MIWKGSTFVLGDWDLKQQQLAAGLGIPFDVILPWLDERQELFLFEIHEDGEMPREWSARVLFRRGGRSSSRWTRTPPRAG